MSRRVERINVLLRQEISLLLSREIKDPRLSGVVTVTHVETSNDLSNARVFISVMGDAEAKKTAFQGVQSATSFIRRGLGERLALRHTPALHFVMDESLERANHLLQIIDSIGHD